MVVLPSVDEDLKNKKDRYLDPNFTSEDGIEACKAALCVMIHRQQFEDATELYDLLVGTGLFDISSYWQTGLLLAKHTKRDPINYLEAAHRICLNRHKVDIFLAYINELVENNDRPAARENIEIIWSMKHGKHPDVQDVLALLNVMDEPGKRLDYLKKRCDNIPTESSFWPSWRPKDKQVSIEYLNHLRENDLDEMKKTAISILQKSGQARKLGLMKIALQYHQPPRDPFDEWKRLMTPYHELDPGADYTIFAQPFIEGQLKQLRIRAGYDRSFIPYKEIYTVLRDRFLAVWFDRWAMKKFALLCKSFLNIKNDFQRRKFSRMILGDGLHEYLLLRKTEIEKEILQEIEAKYEEYDHETVMTLLGSLQDIVAVLERICKLLEKVRMESLTLSERSEDKRERGTTLAHDTSLGRKNPPVRKSKELVAMPSSNEKEVSHSAESGEKSSSEDEESNESIQTKPNSKSVDTLKEPPAGIHLEKEVLPVYVNSVDDDISDNDEESKLISSHIQCKQAPDTLTRNVPTKYDVPIETRVTPNGSAYNNGNVPYKSIEMEEGLKQVELPQCAVKEFEGKKKKKKKKEKASTDGSVNDKVEATTKENGIKNDANLVTDKEGHKKKKKKKKKNREHEESKLIPMSVKGKDEVNKNLKKKKKRSRTHENGSKASLGSGWPKQKKARI
ncbi:hypothetical protein BDA99DRAFT_317052 [Phascolomyces articulosus]|uniref:Uncharacterized protein n=1 Tax=Phascolomyces articulosus TaxID=60185 RepID=A0AAD5JW48_9FUNG|nr:hypothetical protein BDA99DRAFT_317052 [Phascolomyces articulosus]